MFWILLFLSLFVILYVYAFRGIVTQSSNTLSDGGRIFRRIVLICFIPIMIGTVYYSLYKYGETETYAQKVSEKDLYYEHCGKVTKKIEGYGKDNKYEEQFVVAYHDGNTERMDVSRKTFDKYQEGQGICFAEETDWYGTYKTIVGIGWFLTVIGIVICFAYAFEADFE